MSFSYPVDSDTLQGGNWKPDDFDELMKPYRTVFVLKKEQFIANVENLAHVFDETER